MALALWASVAIGEPFAAGEIAFIMQLGAFLEGRTVAKARAGIARLADRWAVWIVAGAALIETLAYLLTG